MSTFESNFPTQSLLGLAFLHGTCKVVHGDLSVNNIVIHRSPLARAPSRNSLASNTKPANSTKNPAIECAESTGVTEDIPVTGIVIDYDYARKLGVVMEGTPVHLLQVILFPCSLIIFPFLGDLALYAS